MSEDGEGAVKSFVLGCSACQGCQEANRVAFNLGEEGGFGYPERRWREFAGGDMLLAAIGEREVRFRLACRAPAELQGGSAAECAERLLLAELGASSAEALLAAAGSSQSDLTRRLEAIGLRQDGGRLELAGRLLLLRERRLESLEPHHFPQLDDDSDLPPLEEVSDHEEELPLSGQVAVQTGSKLLRRASVPALLRSWLPAIAAVPLLLFSAGVSIGVLGQ